MKTRVLSNQKIKDALSYMDQMDVLSMEPEQILQRAALKKALMAKVILFNDLSAYACPSYVLEQADELCSHSEWEDKPRPCAKCWCMALTEEVDDYESPNPVYDEIYDSIKDYKLLDAYKETKATPEDISRILKCLGWAGIQDSVLICDTIRELWRVYREYQKEHPEMNEEMSRKLREAGEGMDEGMLGDRASVESGCSGQEDADSVTEGQEIPKEKEEKEKQPFYRKRKRNRKKEKLEEFA